MNQKRRKIRQKIILAFLTDIFLPSVEKLSSGPPNYPQVTFNKRLEGYRTVPSAHPYHRHALHARVGIHRSRCDLWKEEEEKIWCHRTPEKRKEEKLEELLRLFSAAGHKSALPEKGGRDKFIQHLRSPLVAVSWNLGLDTKDRAINRGREECDFKKSFCGRVQ